MRQFRAAQYRRKLHKESGLFKAPPRFVNEVSRWGIKQLAERVLWEVDQHLYNDRNREEYQNKLDKMLEDEIIRLQAINPDDVIASIDFPGGSYRFTLSHEVMRLLLRFDVQDAPDLIYEVENIGGFEEPVYRVTGYGDLNQTFKTLESIKSYTKTLVNSMVMYLKRNAGRVKPDHFTGQGLVDLNLVRKRCKELGATHGNEAAHISNSIDVNLSDWAYIDVMKKGPVAEEPDDNEALAVFKQFLRDMAELSRGDIRYTQNFEYAPRKLGFVVTKGKNDKNFQLAYTQGDERKSRRLDEKGVRRAVLALLGLSNAMNASELSDMIRRARLETAAIDNLEERLKAVGMTEVDVAISFNSSSDAPLGLWRSDWGAEIWFRPYMPTYSIISLDRFEAVVRELVATIRHEAQHFAQTLLKDVRMMAEEAGLPPPAARNFKYNVHGQSKEEIESFRKRPHGRESPKQREHVLRDIEFQTNLTDVVEIFNTSIKKKVPEKAHTFLIAVFVGIEPQWKPHTYSQKERVAKQYGFTVKFLEELIRKTPNYAPIKMFVDLKREEPKKWRKAASEFVKAVL